MENELFGSIDDSFKQEHFDQLHRDSMEMDRFSRYFDALLAQILIDEFGVSADAEGLQVRNVATKSQLKLTYFLIGPLQP